MVMLMLSIFVGNALAFTDYSGATQYTGEVNATAVMLFDADSGTILYQKNIDQQIEPASTTKIMTLIVALENSNTDDVVTISSKAADTGGSTLDLIANEQVVMKDLLSGMMMKSGNDAAIAVAEFVGGGTVDGFISMMNDTAQRIGMTNSHFVTPHGLHDENHFTTARDMATLTLYAMLNQQFAEIVKRSSYTMPATDKRSSTREAKNTNQLLQPDEANYYSSATGIKTGSTPAAEDCLVSSASKDGMNLICLVFKAPYESNVRWTLTKSLFEWGFENFKTVDITTLLEKTEPVQATVENAAASDSGLLDFNAPEAGTVYVTLDKATVDGIMNDTDSITVEKVLNPDPLQAPITKDDMVGTVTYKSTSTGTVLYTGNLIASRDVPKLGSEPGASGATAVETQEPMLPEKVTNNKDGAGIWWWLLLPGALIAFLVVRLLTVNQRKRKRFKHRQPHYSYKIKKR